MRVIKPGQVVDREHVLECGKCLCQFAFRESEATRVHDRRLIGEVNGERCDGTALKVQCPSCREVLWKAVNGRHRA